MQPPPENLSGEFCGSRVDAGRGNATPRRKLFFGLFRRLALVRQFPAQNKLQPGLTLRQTEQPCRQAAISRRPRRIGQVRPAAFWHPQYNLIVVRGPVPACRCLRCPACLCRHDITPSRHCTTSGPLAARPETVRGSSSAPGEPGRSPDRPRPRPRRSLPPDRSPGAVRPRARSYK